MAWSRRFTAEELLYLERKRSPLLDDAIVPESLFFWQAFHHLRTARTEGLSGGGTIPFGAIKDYCEWAEIDCPVMKARLAKMIIGLDNAERSPEGGI